ncbi:MAG: cell division protein FtsA [bacterium]|nr:cell division protein FtsA [bacterium]
MTRQIAVGIDIGTYQVKVVIAEQILDGTRVIPKIIGVGFSESRGVHHGYITSHNDVTGAIRSAVIQAENGAGLKVRRAFVSVGGIGLSGVTQSGQTIVSRADLEVTELEMNKALESAEQNIPHALSLNRKIINTIPIEYKADGKAIWGRVEGHKAQKIEVKALFIMCLDHHLQDLIKVVEDAGIEVIDIVAAPIAASFVTLSKNQKKAGCVLANIGAETLSVVVFENNTPVSLEVFPIGGDDITNDIALGLKLSLEEAESIKIGSVTATSFSKKKLEEIVSARLSDMLELIENHLKKIGRNALLPAGIIITGGTSGLSNIKNYAESTLKLPSKIAEVHFGIEEKGKIKDSVWAVAYGLAILGFNAENEKTSLGGRNLGQITERGMKWWMIIKEWISRFLP